SLLLRARRLLLHRDGGRFLFGQGRLFLGRSGGGAAVGRATYSGRGLLLATPPASGSPARLLLRPRRLRPVLGSFLRRLVGLAEVWVRYVDPRDGGRGDVCRLP